MQSGITPTSPGPAPVEHPARGCDSSPRAAGGVWADGVVARIAGCTGWGAAVAPMACGVCFGSGMNLALGAAQDLDGRLTEIEQRVDLLLHVTPVNSGEAWRDFEHSDFGISPVLRLRPLEFDPDLLRRELYELRVEDVSDPALHALVRAKRDELARQITALEDRDTSRFVYGSLQLYGGVSESLARSARELLETIPAAAPSTESVTAGVFAEAAREEFERYREAYPDFPVSYQVREDVSELMVSFGQLLIPENAAIRSDRVAPLLHHEIGTHVVTYQNGARQPLAMLRTGLPGYDETQEGLAVLAEYLTGGLDPRRLRVLAARVVAIGQLLDGADLVAIFDSLRSEFSIPARTAWSIASRVAVGGGSVKDAIYLRGIARLLEELAEGLDLEVLLVGKLALDHVPLVQELLGRGVLQPAWVRPRWLDAPGAQERLAGLRNGTSLTDLYTGGRA